MIKLKNLELKTRIIQSPMAGCTDLAFRVLAREHGMEFAFLEMVSSESLVRKNDKTFRLMKSVESDKPLGAQIVGCNPEIMGEATQIVEEMGFDLIDINIGCPVPKITGPGGGSALLKEPKTAKQVISSVVKNANNIPVTVKMRKGYTDDSGSEAVTIAKIAEDAGASAVTVHGRTRAQGYTGFADWEAIGKVKKAVSIPVFGNGDVNCGDDAKKLIEISGCDGVMVGRGALGNPWLYKSIENVLNGKAATDNPTLKEQKAAALKHLELEVQYEGEKIGILKSRRIICWYFKTQPGISQFRGKINKATKTEEVRELIKNFGE